MTRFAERGCGLAVEVELEVRTPAMLDDWSQISVLRYSDQLTRLPYDDTRCYLFSDTLAFHYCQHKLMLLATGLCWRCMIVSISWQSFFGGPEGSVAVR